MNPLAWDELKVTVPAVTVDEDAVVFGNTLPTAVARLLIPETPFCSAAKISLRPIAITFVH